MQSVGQEGSHHVTSSILIVNGLSSETAASLGADHVPSQSDALGRVKEGKHSVYVVHLPLNKPTEFNAAFRNLRQSGHNFEVIFVGDLSLKLIEGLRVFRALSNAQDENYQTLIHAALERVQTTKQNQQLLELIHEQNKKLLALGRSLEERISKRQAYLQKTHAAITETNHRGEAFQRALIAVHRSNTLGEMERLLTEAIAEAFRVIWVRIVLKQNQPLLEQITRDQKFFEVHSVELKLHNESIGTIVVGRKKEPFSRAEKDFFSQISDSVSLALARMKILSQTEEIKSQWEATFNSITSPLALINSRYEVIRANGSFMKQNPGTGALTCYEMLMNRSQPCENCHLGNRFRIDLTGNLGRVTILDVTSQQLGEEDIYVNIYRDISAQLQIETRIMESAKMAELGTIGSSIAHELNNPLGGIITFIQLIKMDLKGKEEFFPDIIALEEAAQKCKEIIQNLLSFSRAPESDKREALNLNTVVKRAIQIVELQSRSSEVVLQSHLSPQEPLLESNFGMLTQVLMTYIMLAIETARVQGIRPIRLKIETQSQSGFLNILIYSPKVSAGFSGPELLRRTIAERILSDLGGSVEYFAEMEGQMLVKIAFKSEKHTSEV